MVEFSNCDHSAKRNLFSRLDLARKWTRRVVDRSVVRDTDKVELTNIIRKMILGDDSYGPS